MVNALLFVLELADRQAPLSLVNLKSITLFVELSFLLILDYPSKQGLPILSLDKLLLKYLLSLLSQQLEDGLALSKAAE